MLPAFVALAVLAGFVFYFVLAGFLYYRFYLRRRDDAAAWKCQPDRFLQPHLVRHAIKLGLVNLTIGGALSGTIAWHIWRGGYTALYFDLGRHSIAYSLFATVLVFFATDAGAYYAHRLLHQRSLYLLIHRVHHRYGAPVPFTVTAMHPAEFLFYQIIFVAPVFLVPLPAVSYYGLLVYIFYFTTIDHSGIKHRSWLPWQPPTRFHDDHHKFFHCNFGQNLSLWDRLHDTLRRRGRRYGEQVYGGRGDGGTQAPRVDYAADES